MKTPESLATLVDYGIIEEVLRPLMSGKEAQIYVVVASGVECVAKVYKEASQRTFKHRAEYTEGRRTRNTRDQRAVSKRTRHGRKQDEAAWRNAEVDMIFRLRDAGVRVPEPINFVDGVLVMELVKDAEGNPAPRLGDLEFAAAEAEAIYRQLIREVVRMLCAGVIHGDLSDFNVLMSAEGPVVIDFPQSVDPAHNRNARKLLLRDVDNLHRFVEGYVPGRRTRRYAEEMWALYEKNQLDPETLLKGDYRPPELAADTAEVMALIDDVRSEEQTRRLGPDHERDEEADFEPAPRPLRAVVDFTKEARPRAPGERAGKPSRKRSGRSSRGCTAGADQPPKAASAEGGVAPKKRRARRRRKPAANASADSNANAKTNARTNAASSAQSSAPAARGADSAATSTERAAPSKGRPRRRRRKSAAARGEGAGGATASAAPRGSAPKGSDASPREDLPKPADRPQHADRPKRADRPKKGAASRSTRTRPESGRADTEAGEAPRRRRRRPRGEGAQRPR